MISLWSVCNATLWFSLCAYLLFTLRRNNNFLMRYGVAAWSSAMFLTVVRLLLPLDIRYMVILRSYHILPKIRRALNHPLVDGFSLKQILRAVWIAGALIGLLLVLYGLLRDVWRQRRLAHFPPSPRLKAAAQACGLPSGVVYISPNVPAPATIGLLRPAIYFPLDDYPDAALPGILKHEFCHVRRHDAWLRLGFSLFRCLFWWNPLVYFAQKSVEDVLELRCDQAALEGASAEEQEAYIKTMKYVGSQVCGHSHPFIGAAFFAQPRDHELLIQRAQLALQDPHPPRWRALTALTLSLILFVVSYLFIWQPAEFPPEKDGGIPIHGFLPQTSYLKQTPSGDYELWSNGEYAGIFPADALDDELFQDLEVVP